MALPIHKSSAGTSTDSQWAGTVVLCGGQSQALVLLLGRLLSDRVLHRAVQNLSILIAGQRHLR